MHAQRCPCMLPFSCMYPHTHRHTDECMHVRMHVDTRGHTHTHMQAHTHARTHTDAQAQTQTHMHAHTHTHRHTRARMHTHPSINIHSNVSKRFIVNMSDLRLWISNYPSGRFQLHYPAHAPSRHINAITVWDGRIDSLNLHSLKHQCNGIYVSSSQVFSSIIPHSALLQ